MFAFNRNTKVYLYREFIDMRSSYDGLFAKVKTILKKDPFSGHLFVFLNKNRTTCKSLYYDGTGFVILSKRLEEGQFSRPNPSGQLRIVLTGSEFSLFWEGASMRKRFIDTPPFIQRNRHQNTLARFKKTMFMSRAGAQLSS